VALGSKLLLFSAFGTYIFFVLFERNYLNTFWAGRQELRMLGILGQAQRGWGCMVVSNMLSPSNLR